MSSILIAVFFIIALEVFLIGLSLSPKTAKWFSVLPVIFWMYFLPGVFAHFGWVSIPQSVSNFSSSWLMPLALILIIAPANLPRLIKMGRPSFVSLLVAYFSMVLAGMICFFVFKPFLAVDAWKAFAALCGTWTGGSVNMLAVKEIVNLSQSQFSSMVITDSFLSYGWMVLLILCYRWSDVFNRWTQAKQQSSLEGINEDLKPRFHKQEFIWISLGLVIVLLAHGIASLLPSGEILSKKAWVLLLASTFAIIAAALGWHKLIKSIFADRIGSWILYFVLMVMGAQADFVPKSQDLVIVLVGILWLVIHGSIMVSYAKLFKVKLSVLAVASQASIGGVVSAPVLAGVYDRSLVSMAVLMGIFGNMVGTYLALLLGNAIRVLS